VSARCVWRDIMFTRDEAHLQQLLKRKQAFVILINNRQGTAQLQQRRLSLCIRILLPHRSALVRLALAGFAQYVAALT
jgi:hypothetical protein